MKGKIRMIRSTQKNGVYIVCFENCNQQELALLEMIKKVEVKDSNSISKPTQIKVENAEIKKPKNKFANAIIKKV